MSDEYTFASCASFTVTIMGNSRVISNVEMFMSFTIYASKIRLNGIDTGSKIRQLKYSVDRPGEINSIKRINTSQA